MSAGSLSVGKEVDRQAQAERLRQRAYVGAGRGAALLIGEQYAITVDQLARLIGRTHRTARWLRDRWRKAGWVESRQLAAGGPSFLWLTRQGTRIAQLALIAPGTRTPPSPRTSRLSRRYGCCSSAAPPGRVGLRALARRRRTLRAQTRACICRMRSWFATGADRDRGRADAEEPRPARGDPRATSATATSRSGTSPPPTPADAERACRRAALAERARPSLPAALGRAAAAA